MLKSYREGTYEAWQPLHRAAHSLGYNCRAAPSRVGQVRNDRCLCDMIATCESGRHKTCPTRLVSPRLRRGNPCGCPLYRKYSAWALTTDGLPRPCGGIGRACELQRACWLAAHIDRRKRLNLFQQVLKRLFAGSVGLPASPLDEQQRRARILEKRLLQLVAVGLSEDQRLLGRVGFASCSARECALPESRRRLTRNLISEAQPHRRLRGGGYRCQRQRNGGQCSHTLVENRGRRTPPPRCV